jgi:F-type H+-transporting ATPase subunit epsilon
MASRDFQCTLITPEARMFQQNATSAVLPLHDGSAGVLPRRAPFVAKLGTGEFRITFVEGGSRSYFLDEGFVQMVGDHMTVLAQDAIPAEKLSQSEAEAELAAATARKAQSSKDMEQISRERSRARAKVDIAKKFQQQGGGI